MTLFGLQKLGGLITLELHVHDICNLAGVCCIIMSKMWQCSNFQFLSVNGPILGIFGPQNVRAVLNKVKQTQNITLIEGNKIISDKKNVAEKINNAVPSLNIKINDENLTNRN